ncbi:MAG: hypothetical protein DRI80_14960, partial [Chloroflexota bacterium]
MKLWHVLFGIVFAGTLFLLSSPLTAHSGDAVALQEDYPQLIAITDVNIDDALDPAWLSGD